MSNDYQKKLASPEWRERRREILERDGFECQECGDDSEGLHVHHITPVSDGGSDDDENLRTLCPSCHRKAHTDGSEIRIVEDGQVLREPKHDGMTIEKTSTKVTVPDPDLLTTKRVDNAGRLYLGQEFAETEVHVVIESLDDGDDEE
jgi:hypothetical protein